MTSDSFLTAVSSCKYKIQHVVIGNDKVFRSDKVSSLEVNFPISNQWTPILTSINRDEGSLSKMDNFSGYQYFSLLSHIVNNDTLFNLLQSSGQQFIFRYHLKYKIKGIFEDSYSNIDTTYFPKLTALEVQAIHYLRTSKLDIDKFVSLNAIDNYKEYPKYEYLVNNYSGTVIADMAAIAKLIFDLKAQSEPNDSGYTIPASVRSAAVATCYTLLNSLGSQLFDSPIPKLLPLPLSIFKVSNPR